VLLTASPSLPWLVLSLFGLGLALGCDYPTAHRIPRRREVRKWLRNMDFLDAQEKDFVHALRTLS
jgi:hypothetical protein